MLVTAMSIMALFSAERMPTGSTRLSRSRNSWRNSWPRARPIDRGLTSHASPSECPAEFVGPGQVGFAIRLDLGQHAPQNLHPGFLDPDAQEPVVEEDP